MEFFKRNKMENIFELFTTKDFKLSELVKNGNEGLVLPPDDILYNVITISQNILQPLRDSLNCPITVHSCFRTKTHNSRVGGAYNSQHLQGMAVDFSCKENEKALLYIMNNIRYDQLIVYLNKDHSINFIHCSISWRKDRKQVLYKINDRMYNYRP